MEQPFNVFYAVVCKHPHSPKAYRNNTPYITATRSVEYLSITPHVWKSNDDRQGEVEVASITKSNAPILFRTKEEAEAIAIRAKKYYAKMMDVGEKDDTEYEVEAIRIVESEWTPYRETNSQENTAIDDARNIARGLLHYTAISEHVKKLAGRVLTILDASYVNENQNKAVKDLVKSSFRAQLQELWKCSIEDPHSEGSEGKQEEDILD